MNHSIQNPWYAHENLYQAWLRVRKKDAQGGLDNRSIQDYARHLKNRLHKLSHDLAARSYIPQPGKRINIRKSDGSLRPISLSTVEDKIVQIAAKEFIEPLFENEFLPCSYAYRPGRGHRKAINNLRHYLSQKMHFITTCDIDTFFESINHELLIKMIKQKINDAYILDLIQMWLKIGSFIGDRYIETKEGVPQGGVISPLLSNVYLHPFDVEMTQRKAHYVRYADDFIIAERTSAKAHDHFQFASGYLQNELKLKLNPMPQPVSKLSEGFTFLGLHFKASHITIDQKKVQKALDKVEKIFGKALRKPFHETINELNESIRSWQYYYGECENRLAFQEIQSRILEKISYLIHRLTEEGRLPTRGYLSGNLQRLKWLLPTSASEKSGWLNELLKGKKKLAAPHPPASSSLPSAQHKKVKPQQTTLRKQPPVVSEAPPWEAPPKSVSAVEARQKQKAPLKPKSQIKRALAARRQKFIRQFASEFDLVLSSYGCFLGRHSQRLVVKHPNGKIKEYAASKIKHIIVMNPAVTLSSAALYLCASHQIPIDFIDHTGKPFARLAAPEKPAWRYGMYQLEAQKNNKGLHIAKALVEGKVRNQHNLLKYYSKYRKNLDKEFIKLFEQESARIETYIDELDRIAADANLDEVRGTLFGIEGRAASAYWRTVRYLLRERVKFEGREHRGAQDLVNSLLNYGYGILYSRVWGALMLAGLNVQISFLHRPQYEKPTLVFDLIEEFRTPVVDRTVFSMITRGEKFNIRNGYLDEASKNKIVENIFERLNTPVKFRQQRRTLQEIILYQAKNLGKFLKGEVNSYRPFIAKW